MMNSQLFSEIERNMEHQNGEFYALFKQIGNTADSSVAWYVKVRGKQTNLIGPPAP